MLTDVLNKIAFGKFKDSGESVIIAPSMSGTNKELTKYKLRFWDKIKGTKTKHVQDMEFMLDPKIRFIPKKQTPQSTTFGTAKGKKDPRNVYEKSTFKALVQPYDYWTIPEFDIQLKQIRDELFRDGLQDNMFQETIFAHTLYLYENIDEDFQRAKDALAPSEEKLITKTIEKTFQRISEFIGARLTEYSGISLFDSAYNHTLLYTTYREAYKYDNEITVELRNTLICLRAIFQKCDYLTSILLSDMAEGRWSSVRLTDMDIPNSDSETEFTFIDLFAGIGSFRKSLERSSGACVFTNDILAPSLYAYSQNFNIEEGEINLDYIENFIYQGELKDIPDMNCLVAGFPCKSFSSIGKLKRAVANPLAMALGDPAFGFLIFDTMRIVKEKKPAFFILENVKQFVTDDAVWKDIIEPSMTDPNFSVEDIPGLEEHGKYVTIPTKTGEKEVYVPGRSDLRPRFTNLDGEYDVHVRILNSRGYSCQDRDRCFIIGIRKDLGVNFNYDLLPYIRTKRAAPSESRFESPIAKYVNSAEDYLSFFQDVAMHSPLEKTEPPYTLPFGEDNEFSIPSPKYNITYATERNARYKLLQKKLDKSSPEYKMLHQGSKWKGIRQLSESEIDFIMNSDIPLVGKGAYGFFVFDENGADIVNTLTGNCGEDKIVGYQCLLSDKRIYRTLTPRETVRIMTFDRDPTARMPLPIADTDAFTLSGYSIVTKLLEEITIYTVANLLYNVR
jgi:site-specific DNA-cytosine methylase